MNRRPHGSPGRRLGSRSRFSGWVAASRLRLTKISLFSALAILLLVSAALGAHVPAPGTCNSREALLAWLYHVYREAPVVSALTNNGYHFEIVRSEDGGTYSVLLTPPGRQTCYIGGGTNWRDIPFEPPSESAS